MNGTPGQQEVLQHGLLDIARHGITVTNKKPVDGALATEMLKEQEPDSAIKGLEMETAAYSRFEVSVDSFMQHDTTQPALHSLLDRVRMLRPLASTGAH